MSTLKLVSSYSKRKYLLNWFKRCCSQSADENLNRSDISKKSSGLNEVVKDKRIGYVSIKKLSPAEVDHRLNKLKELGLTDSNNGENMLIRHHPKTIWNRYLILKEIGIKNNLITCSLLDKYLKLVKLSVSRLKIRKLLEKEVQVLNNFVSLTPLDISDLDPFYSKPERSPEMIKDYITEKLLTEVVGYVEPYEEKKFLLQRLRHKSIEETMRNLNVLIEQVEIPIDKIRSNPFLLTAADADNTTAILEGWPQLGGVDIKTVVNMYPKILASSVDNFAAIYKALKDEGIRDEALNRNWNVFTLSSETVRRRLEEAKKHKFFSLCTHHPNILKLIFYHNKAKLRFDMLNHNGVHFVTLNLLATSSANFNRFYTGGYDKYQGKDSIYYLAEELGVDREFVKKRLEKHPYWVYASLLSISKNLSVLRSRGFSSQQIVNEIYILLYPQDKILEEVDRVELRKECNECRDPSTGIIDKSYILPLVLYFLEKETNFSGAGIWLKETGERESPPSQTIVKHSTDYIPASNKQEKHCLAMSSTGTTSSPLSAQSS